MVLDALIDLSGGDFKAGPHDPFAVFRLDRDTALTLGFEICLDHADHRRRWPPAGGWAFNVDGEYALGARAAAGTRPSPVRAGPR